MGGGKTKTPLKEKQEKGILELRLGAGEGIPSTGIPRIVYPGGIQQFQTILGARNRIPCWEMPFLGMEFRPLSHSELDFFPEKRPWV